MGSPKRLVTASEVAAYKATEYRQVIGLGDALYLVIERAYGDGKGGGKSFKGVIRFPFVSVKNGAKRCEVVIGKYGKGYGEWTLKAARDEWDRIRTWSRENNRDPRELKREEKAGLVIDSKATTLEEACEAYCSESKNATISEYRNILWKQWLPHLGGHLPIKHFEWDFKQQNGRTGRDLVMQYHDRKKSTPVEQEKVLMVLRQVFNYAIDKGWVERNQNPALKPLSKKSTHNHSSSALWDRVPQFFKDLTTTASTSVLFAACKMTFHFREWNSRLNVRRIGQRKICGLFLLRG